MKLAHWLILIGLLVGIGCLQVAQRNALFFKGYAVGERMSRLHTQETEVAWLSAEVEGLTSPTHLAQVAQERRLKLVAWSPLAPQVYTARVVSGPSGMPGAAAAKVAAAGPPLVHVAAVDPDQVQTGNDTSD